MLEKRLERQQSVSEYKRYHFRLSSPPVGGEPLQELLCPDHSEEPVVLRVEDGVGAERLRHVLVEVRGEGQVRVQVEHQTPLLVRAVQEQNVVVPDHQLLLVLAGLLPPERDHL